MIYYYLQGDEQTQHAVARTSTAAALLTFGAILRKQGFPFRIYQVVKPAEGSTVSETPLSWEQLQEIAAEEVANGKPPSNVQLSTGPK